MVVRYCMFCGDKMTWREGQKVCRKSECKRRSWMNSHFKRTYGIDIFTYEKLFEQQNGDCKICKRSHSTVRKGQRLCVDHDHKTGEVRGLLCLDCNYGLGTFGEDIERLKSAITYLERAKI